MSCQHQKSSSLYKINTKNVGLFDFQTGNSTQLSCFQTPTQTPLEAEYLWTIDPA